MFRMIAGFLALLFLLTACTAPAESIASSASSESSSASESASEASEISSSAEASSSETLSSSDASSSTETEREENSLYPSWYEPLADAPDFETYFATERHIVSDPDYNGWQTASYLFYVGENGNPYNTIGTYEELTDHNLYRQTKGGEPKKELLVEGDFRCIRVTEQFVYLFDNENVVWRMPYPEGELEELYRLPQGADCESANVYDNGLLLIYADGQTHSALYIPTGDVIELGPVFQSDSRKATRFLPLTNRSYLYRVAPIEELAFEETPPNEKYYIYSGTDGKAYELDVKKLGLRVIADEDIPALFPLDENGVFAPNECMQEVSLEEAELVR